MKKNILFQEDNEEFCVSSLCDYLKCLLNINDYNFCRVAKNMDPPDYYLNAFEKTFAIEVTEFKETLKNEEKELEKNTVIESLFGIINEIENEIKSENSVTQCFPITFSGVFSNYNKFKKTIKVKIIDYILSNNGNVHSSEWSTLFAENSGLCKIKTSDKKSFRILDASYEQKHETIKLKEYYFKLFKERILDKQKKLGEIENEKILLIRNRTILGLPNEFAEFAKELPETSFFYKIFIIEEDKAFLIFEKNNHW